MAAFAFNYIQRPRYQGKKKTSRSPPSHTAMIRLNFPYIIIPSAGAKVTATAPREIIRSSMETFLVRPVASGLFMSCQTDWPRIAQNIPRTQSDITPGEYLFVCHPEQRSSCLQHDPLTIKQSCFFGDIQPYRTPFCRDSSWQRDAFTAFSTD